MDTFYYFMFQSIYFDDATPGLFLDSKEVSVIPLLAGCIIIIISFYGIYILRNLTSEVQQNRIIKHNREQGCTKVVTRMRDHRRFMMEMQFRINMS